MLFEGPFKLQALGEPQTNNLQLSFHHPKNAVGEHVMTFHWHGKNDGRQWHKPNTTLNNNWNSSAMIWTYMT